MDNRNQDSNVAWYDQKEIMELLSSVTQLVKVRKPLEVTRSIDFFIPIGECKEYFYTEDIPYLEMKEIAGIKPISIAVKGDEQSFQERYKYDGRLFEDNRAWMIETKKGRVFFVVNYHLNDPSYGLYGAMGSWIPNRTILFDCNGNELSEHSEIHGGDHIRIDQVTCKKESFIRWLTVHRMIKSEFSGEISLRNDRIKELYAVLLDVHSRICDEYRKREGVEAGTDVLMYEIGENKKIFMDRNNDLNL